MATFELSNIDDSIKLTTKINSSRNCRAKEKYCLIECVHGILPNLTTYEDLRLLDFNQNSTNIMSPNLKISTFVLKVSRVPFVAWPQPHIPLQYRRDHYHMNLYLISFFLLPILRLSICSVASKLRFVETGECEESMQRLSFWPHVQRNVANFRL